MTEYVVLIKTIFNADAQIIKSQVLATPDVIHVRDGNDPHMFVISVLTAEALATVRAIDGILVSENRVYKTQG